MKTKILFACFLIALQGCASPEDYPMNSSDIKPQTYTYLELNDSQSNIWKKARNYIASAFGNSKAVMRVEDEKEGTLIGKGIVRWKMMNSSLSPYCLSNYDIRFIAKDNKARLQLELTPGVPPLSQCTAWYIPSVYGYNQIINDFNSMSAQLEESLRGQGKIESMDDF